MHGSPDSISDLINKLAAQREQAWINFRRARHTAPEPSGEETETSQVILQAMLDAGLEAHIPNRGVGVVADLHAGEAQSRTPPVVVRADIDALRMSDRKTCEYASQRDGLAHACGHDVHTTVVCGVAQLLAALQQTGRGPSCPVRFVFQSSEETGDGAQWMIDDGYIDSVRSIIGLHVEPLLLAGQVGIRYGALTAAVDEVIIEIRGAGGHTARPHLTTDPVHCAAQLISYLYQSLPRAVDVRKPSVFTVGQLDAGRTSNVIPDRVRVAGTLRATEKDTRLTLLERLQNACHHFAELTGNTIEVTFGHRLAAVYNTPRETAACEQSVCDVANEDAVQILQQPSMGGEDFGVYLQNCEGGCQIRLGCAASLPWPHLHSPEFDIDESAIGLGVRVLTRTVLRLADPENDNG